MSKVLETQAETSDRTAETTGADFLAEPATLAPMVFTVASDSSAAHGPSPLSSSLSTSLADVAVSSESTAAPRPRVWARRALTPTRGTAESVSIEAGRSERLADGADSWVLKLMAVSATLLTVAFLVYVALDFLS